jgi:uncharacterized protein (TIGR02271 family)
MPSSDIHKGMTVRAADGRKLGKVVAASADAVLVEQGLLNPKDSVASLSGAHVREGEVILAEGAQDLTAWDAARDFTRGAEWSDEENVRVPLLEEELVAHKIPREIGAVRIHKYVVTEERTFTVQIRREELRVERVAARGASLSIESDEGMMRLGAPLEQAELIIPLHEEEVEVVKTPKVRELVRVRKTIASTDRTLSAHVRREEARVEKHGEFPLHAEGSTDSSH